MRILIVIATLLFSMHIGSAQSPLPIGQTTLQLTDPARGNRSITTEVYYPGVATGSNVPVAGGPGTVFPVFSFGHGFSMGYDAYQNIWNELVPKGYIVALPTTESGTLPAPSHNDFALDLAFIIDHFQVLNQTGSSIFHQKVSPNSAIGGHSMGGGSTVLAAGNQPNIKTIVTMAAAETNPSAVAVCSNINVPTLFLIGENDCVAPSNYINI